MAGRGKRGRSFADERRLIALAASLKSLEAIARATGRTPRSIATSAKRLGISLKSADNIKVMRSRRVERVLVSRG